MCYDHLGWHTVQGVGGRHLSTNNDASAQHGICEVSSAKHPLKVADPLREWFEQGLNEVDKQVTINKVGERGGGRRRGRGREN